MAMDEVSKKKPSIPVTTPPTDHRAINITSKALAAHKKRKQRAQRGKKQLSPGSSDKTCGLELIADAMLLAKNNGWNNSKEDKEDKEVAKEQKMTAEPAAPMEQQPKAPAVTVTVTPDQKHQKRSTRSSLSTVGLQRLRSRRNSSLDQVTPPTKSTPDDDDDTLERIYSAMEVQVSLSPNIAASELPPTNNRNRNTTTANAAAASSSALEGVARKKQSDTQREKQRARRDEKQLSPGSSDKTCGLELIADPMLLAKNTDWNDNAKEDKDDKEVTEEQRQKDGGRQQQQNNGSGVSLPHKKKMTKKPAASTEQQPRNKRTIVVTPDQNSEKRSPRSSPRAIDLSRQRSRRPSSVKQVTTLDNLPMSASPASASKNQTLQCHHRQGSDSSSNSGITQRILFPSVDSEDNNDNGPFLANGTRGGGNNSVTKVADDSNDDHNHLSTTVTTPAEDLATLQKDVFLRTILGLEPTRASRASRVRSFFKGKSKAVDQLPSSKYDIVEEVADAKHPKQQEPTAASAFKGWRKLARKRSSLMKKSDTKSGGNGSTFEGVPLGAKSDSVGIVPSNQHLLDSNTNDDHSRIVDKINNGDINFMNMTGGGDASDLLNDLRGTAPPPQPVLKGRQVKSKVRSSQETSTLNNEASQDDTNSNRNNDDQPPALLIKSKLPPPAITATSGLLMPRSSGPLTSSTQITSPTKVRDQRVHRSVAIRLLRKQSERERGESWKPTTSAASPSLTPGLIARESQPSPSPITTAPLTSDLLMPRSSGPLTSSTQITSPKKVRDQRVHRSVAMRLLREQSERERGESWKPTTSAASPSLTPGLIARESRPSPSPITTAPLSSPSLQDPTTRVNCCMSSDNLIEVNDLVVDQSSDGCGGGWVSCGIWPGFESILGRPKKASPLPAIQANDSWNSSDSFSGNNCALWPVLLSTRTIALSRKISKESSSLPPDPAPCTVGDIINIVGKTSLFNLKGNTRDEQIIIVEKTVLITASMLSSSSGSDQRKATVVSYVRRSDIRALTLDVEATGVTLAHSQGHTPLMFESLDVCLEFCSAFYGRGVGLGSGGGSGAQKSSSADAQVLPTPSIQARRIAWNASNSNDEGSAKGQSNLTLDERDLLVGYSQYLQNNQTKLRGSTNKLTEEDEKIATKFHNMQKMGVPPDAAKHKITAEEVDSKIIDAVIRTQPQEWSRQASQLSSKEEVVANKYRKMLKMGVPLGGVQNKMQQEGVNPKMISVLMDEASDGGKAGGATARKPIAKKGEKMVAVPVLSAEEEKIALAYRNMLKYCIPKDAVQHKLKQEGIAANIIDAVLGKENGSDGGKENADCTDGGGGANKRKTIGLHWTTQNLAPELLKQSIFGRTELQTRKLISIKREESDIQKLEELFQKRNSKAGSNMKGSGRGSDGKDGKFSNDMAKLLDLTRANNIAISLRAFKDFTSRLLAETINDLDPDERIVGERVQFIPNLLPSPKEIAAIKQYKGDDNKLLTAELFFRQLTPIKRIKDKVSVMNTMVTFEEHISRTRAGFKTLQEVCVQVMNSKKLMQVLEMVLKVGNLMNAGTLNGGVEAFKFESLARLSQTKSVDGKTTVLDYIVQRFIEKGKRKALLLMSEFPDIQDSSRLSVDDLNGYMSTLQTDYKLCKRELASMKRDQSSKRVTVSCNGNGVWYQAPVFWDESNTGDPRNALFAAIQSKDGGLKEQKAPESCNPRQASFALIKNKNKGNATSFDNDDESAPSDVKYSPGVHRLQTFLNHSTTTLLLVEYDQDAAMRTCKDLAMYCGEQDERAAAPLLKVLSDFALSLEYGVKKYDNRVAAEKRKAAKNK